MPSQPTAPHYCYAVPPIPFELVDTDNDTKRSIEVYCTLVSGHPDDHQIAHDFFELEGGMRLEPQEYHWR